MWPKGVVLPAAAIGQDLRLRSGGEQLGVQELISEAAVERLGDAVLPRGHRFAVGGAGGSGLTPVP